MRSNLKGRQAKNKARLARFEELNSQEFQIVVKPTKFTSPGQRLETKLSKAALRKTFGERLLFEGLSFIVPKGSIVGIIGANGMGKSTLFKIPRAMDA